MKSEVFIDLGCLIPISYFNQIERDTARINKIRLNETKDGDLLMIFGIMKGDNYESTMCLGSSPQGVLYTYGEQGFE
jgi:hypothetical protein